MSTVLAFSEDVGLAGEVFSAARGLAASLGAEPLLLELDEVRGGVQADGKALLVKAKRRLSGDAELTSRAIAEVARKKGASVVLTGATRQGRVVAAQIAVLLGWGVMAEVKGLSAEGGGLVGERAAYAGKFAAKVSARVPCLATVLAGAYQPLPGSPSVEAVEVQDITPRIAHIETRPKPKGSVDLKSASIIVSAGRGIKKKEDLGLVDQLAKALGGAVGCSRPLSSDLGWLGEEQHIGLTGVYVHPDLYVAVGISGQLQHIAGIKDSKVIVAINKDRQAPIFQVSDYGVVGDLYQVVPAILKALASS